MRNYSTWMTLGLVGWLCTGCAPPDVLVGGTVSGLRGEGLVLQSLGATLSVQGDGPFAFSRKLKPGEAWEVTVAAQPTSPSQTCTVQGGSGVAATTPIDSVRVVCVTDRFTLGGTVTGLLGSGLVLTAPGNDPLAIALDGTFAFPAPVASGTAFAVAVATQPTRPLQRCTVSQGSGVVGGGPVSGVVVACIIPTFGVHVEVSGLAGTGLVLRNRGGDDLAVARDGRATFATQLLDEAPFEVTVARQPSSPTQTCVVTGGAGAVPAGEVTTVSVACTTNRYLVRGMVIGLLGQGLTLLNSGGAPLPIAADGTFAFPALVASGAPYAVTIGTQPSSPSQTCAASGATGTVGAADVGSVVINCMVNRYTLGGTITGLAGTVTLVNGLSVLVVSANGTFAFGTTLPSGALYAVSLQAQPTSPWQTCTVAGSAGTVGAANVTSVAVSCVTNSFAVRGTVTGLAGAPLVLQDSWGDDLPVTGNGPFAFATRVLSGATYWVTVKTQPTSPWQTCTVAGGTGTMAGADVTGVVVTCVTNTYRLGGSVTGLQGVGLVLQQGADAVTVSTSGTFAFPARVASGASYAVTVKTQPTTPWQTCAVTAGSGTVASADVTSVGVSCVTNRYAVRATVGGLLGAGLVVRDDRGQEQAVSANGPVSFPGTILSGASYAVTVKTQPTSPWQTCSVGGGAGVMAGADLDAVVTCVTNTYALGGVVSGLAGSGLVLQNGADTVTVAAAGVFAFPLGVASLASYAVTVKTQPRAPSQTCAVTAGAGTVAGAEVTSVTVACVTNPFSVGGTVTGLAGSGLVLTNGGVDPLPLAADGTFTFPGTLNLGDPYAVAVKTQPAGPTQTCTVTSGTGTLTASIASVVVTCVTNTYPVGGNVTGLAGSGLVLRDNGGDDLPLALSGSFTFPTRVTSGQPFLVTVASQPTGPSQTCVVTGGSGTITSGAVASVVVACTTNSYAITARVIGLSGHGLVLQNSGAQNKAVAADGVVTFTSQLSGTPFAITALTQPSGPAQTCLVKGGAGTLGGAAIEARVVCSVQSCKALHALAPTLPTDTYSLDPDGVGAQPPFLAFCDQQTDGGGWTLLTWTGLASALPWGVPYPGLAPCPTLDCLRGSGVPGGQIDALFQGAVELASAESVYILRKATYGVLGSYQSVGKYNYGSLATVSVLYGPNSCTTTGALTGAYTPLVDGGDAGVVYLDRHLSYKPEYSDYSADTNAYIWNIGTAVKVCDDSETPPGTWMGTVFSGQFGPTIGYADGSFSIWVR